MKIFDHSFNRLNRAFTLVELLTVIAIIAILASLLLVVIPHVMTAAKVRKAGLQMNDIAGAVQAYEAAYGHFPVSHAAQGATTNDVTYGANFQSPGGIVSVGTPVGGLVLSNAEVMAVLMNFTNFPNTTTPTVNVNGLANPQRTAFLNATLASDTASPGVGSDLVYRDPWGNPYVISLDVNDDGLCEDQFYGSATVSAGGLNGLILQPDGRYAFHGKIMVWSAGPDGKINPGQPANTDANKDNVLNWH